MSRPAGAPTDRGAFRERTLLAWVRTALAFAGCAVLVARLVELRHPAAAPATALLGLAVAAGLAGAAAARYRLSARRPEALLAGLVCTTTLASLGLAAAGLLMAALPG